VIPTSRITRAMFNVTFRIYDPDCPVPEHILAPNDDDDEDYKLFGWTKDYVIRPSDTDEEYKEKMWRILGEAERCEVSRGCC
jgi:hypothetical protein